MSGRSQVPRGVRKKDLCKCGRTYWNYCEGNKLHGRGACTICKEPLEAKGEAKILAMVIMGIIAINFVSASLLDGLVGYWNFEGEDNAYSDRSEYANTLIAVNQTHVSSECGVSGNGLCLDGDGDYAYATYIDAYNMTGKNLTVIAFVYNLKTDISNNLSEAELLSGAGYNITRGSITYRMGNFTTGAIALVNEFKFENSQYGTFSFTLTGNTTATNAINYTVKDSITGAIMRTGATTSNTGGVNGQITFTGFQVVGRDFNISVYYTNLSAEASLNSITVGRGGRDGIVSRNQNWRSHTSDTTWRAIVRNLSGTDVSISPNSQRAGQWEMVTLVYNGSRVYMYQNTSRTSSGTVNGILFNNRNNLTIGFDRDFGFGTSWMNLDEISIYNRTLNDLEIKEYYYNNVGYPICAELEEMSQSLCTCDTTIAKINGNNQCDYYQGVGNTGNFANSGWRLLMNAGGLIAILFTVGIIGMYIAGNIQFYTMIKLFGIVLMFSMVFGVILYAMA